MKNEPKKTNHLSKPIEEFSQFTDEELLEALDEVIELGAKKEVKKKEPKEIIFRYFQKKGNIFEVTKKLLNF